MLDLGSNPTSDILSEAEIKGSAKNNKKDSCKYNAFGYRRAA